MPPDAASHASALAGVTVLEAGSLIAGPFAGRLLAEFGAEVIKLEAPDRPDPLREWGSSAMRATRCGGRCTRATRSA